MASYKAPTFSERLASAKSAKDRALAALKAKPPIDAAVLEQRRATAEAREAKLARQRAAKRDAVTIATKAKTSAAEKLAVSEEKAGAQPVATEEERKAARDARYAARKNARK